MTFILDCFLSQVAMGQLFIAGGENRTLTSSLGSSQATITLRPLTFINYRSYFFVAQRFSKSQFRQKSYFPSE